MRGAWSASVVGSEGKKGVGGMGQGGGIEWILKICVSWIELA
jgi:hypothetical protein